jgi:hypothetical protein
VVAVRGASVDHAARVVTVADYGNGHPDFGYPDLYRWVCVCGASDGDFETQAEAHIASMHHAEPPQTPPIRPADVLGGTVEGEDT